MPSGNRRGASKGVARRRRGRRFLLPSRRAALLAALIAVGLLGACTSGADPSADVLDRVPGGADGAGGTDEALTTAPPGSTSRLVERRSYALGDCVWWAEAEIFDVRDTKVVPCSEAHVLEVTGRHTITDQTGEYPGSAYWDALLTSGRCLALAEAYLGVKLDPAGNLYAHGVVPSPESWRDGDRDVWCGIGVWPYDAERLAQRGPDESIGRARASEQYRVFAVGSCLGPSGKEDDTAWGVVPCDVPHSLEVAGHFDLSGLAERPPHDRWARTVDRDCSRLATAYIGAPLREPVQAASLEIEAASWDAGRRTVVCTVAEYVNNEPATITRRIGPE